MNQIDTLLIVRAGSLLLTAWTVRPLLCHAGLVARLVFEAGRNRALWPGPRTIFRGMMATRVSAPANTKSPYLYPRYLMAVSGMLLVALTFGGLFYQSMRPHVAPASIGSLVFVVVGAALVFARFARTAEFYSSMVEWALSELPRQALDTDEPDKEVAQAFVAIRKGVNRIWTNVWLAALSTIFIVGVWQSPHRRLSEAAIMNATIGPLQWEHVERVMQGGEVIFVRNPQIGVADIPNARLMVALAECTLADGHKLLGLKPKRGPAAELMKRADLCALLYPPEWRLPYPGVGSEYPSVLVAIASEDNLVRFAKSQRTMNLLFSLLYVGFMANGLYLVIGLRRWLRGSRMKKGKHNL